MHTESIPELVSFEMTGFPFLPSLNQMAWVYPPTTELRGQPAIWLVALPGAAITGRAYVDRQIPESALTSSLMAQTLARQGIGSLVLDHLGTGENQCALSGQLLAPSLYASMYAHLLYMLRARLASGRLLPSLPALALERLWVAGCGHDLGGTILTALQGTYPTQPFLTCDGCILLGWSPGRLDMPETLPLEEHTATQGYLVGSSTLHCHLRSFLYSCEVPLARSKGHEREALTVPTGLTHLITHPGALRAEAAKIRSPLFLEFAAKREVTHEPEKWYPEAESVTRYRQPDAHQYTNVDPSRQGELWEQIARWCYTQAEQSLQHRTG